MTNTMLVKIKKGKEYGNLWLEEWLLLESQLQLISILMHDINMCKINSLGIFQLTEYFLNFEPELLS